MYIIDFTYNNKNKKIISDFSNFQTITDMETYVETIICDYRKTFDNLSIEKGINTYTISADDDEDIFIYRFIELTDENISKLPKHSISELIDRIVNFSYTNYIKTFEFKHNIIIDKACYVDTDLFPDFLSKQCFIKEASIYLSDDMKHIFNCLSENK